MPYQDHPTFTQPPDDTVIWRYMTLDRFADVLASRAIYFRQSDRLDDPYEGIDPVILKLVETADLSAVPPAQHDLYRGHLERTRQMFLEWRGLLAINCWHKNPDESAAMWKIYGGEDKSVAIRSTMRRLRESFSGCKEVVHIGDIQYLDYRTDRIMKDNVFQIYLAKRRSFAFEQELRVIYDRHMTYNWHNAEIIDFGVKLAIEVETLIDRVFVAPRSDDDFVGRVNEVVKRNGFKSDVEKSALYTLM
jgi:hypothetical protein